MDDFDLTTSSRPAPDDPDANMRKLGEAATRIFAALIDGLLVGDARKIDNAHGAFMAVSIDHLGRSSWGSLYAIAHRYEVNGDLVPDPDVEFYVVDLPSKPGAKAVYPTAIDHGLLGYHRHVHFNSDGRPIRISSQRQASLATFCDGWMKAIAAQQRLVLS
jgi:hypothetical protein